MPCLHSIIADLLFFVMIAPHLFGKLSAYKAVKQNHKEDWLTLDLFIEDIGLPGNSRGKTQQHYLHKQYVVPLSSSYIHSHSTFNFASSRRVYCRKEGRKKERVSIHK